MNQTTPAAPATAVATSPLLEVENLTVEFATRAGTFTAVDQVSFTVESGRTLAILGESGSGKSMTALGIMGLVPKPGGRVTGGSVRLLGTELRGAPESTLRGIRGARVAMIFQDPMSSLNPVFTVGDQIGEMFRRHRGMGRRAARDQAVALMERVGIPDAGRRVGHYPHQFSGGMRQRVMIAMALALDPELLIADEPTTALDVTVQAQIIRLLTELQAERGMGLILITHDLGVVAGVADRLAVMYGGRIVEDGPMLDVHDQPSHPYTVGLMQSVPRMERKTETLQTVDGQPPSPLSLPSGCVFHPRCPYAADECRTRTPHARQVGADHHSACHFADQVRLRGREAVDQ